MICPNCGCSIPDDARCCGFCGERLVLRAGTAAGMPAFTISETDPGAPISLPDSPAESAAPKQGTHWIPLVIMAMLCVIGLTLFFCLPYNTGADPSATVSESATPWFVNDGGTLHFIEELYTGPMELIVPETVSGVAVERLGEECFAYCTELTTVILPDSLVAIDSNAFSGCTAMRGIFIPEGVSYIGTGAFSNCISLEAICIPASVETIESGAFDGCGELAHIFYNGIHSHWNDLYSEFICLKTQVYCTDGTFIHRGKTP